MFKKINLKTAGIFLLLIGAATSSFNWINSEKNPNGFVIILKENGFEPKVLEVPKDAEVIFKSNLGESFWPASDFHPIHNIYPEFDPQKPISADSTWKFKFEKSGRWKYHDHLSPYFTGEIIVTDSEQTSQNSDCEESESLQCLQTNIQISFDTGGIEAAFSLVSEYYKIIPSFPQNCHFITHNMGVYSYKFYKISKDLILSPNSSFCASGFYHGFMEALLTKTRNYKEARDFCEYVDKKIGSLSSDSMLQCYHGIGHGAVDMSLRENNIGNEDSLINPALELCEKASKTEDRLYRCTSGVFNGIANFYINGEYGLIPNQKDPLSTCHKQINEYKESCYGNFNALIFWMGENNFKKASKYLSSIEDNEFKLPAMRYLAGNASLYNGTNPNESVIICRTFDDKMHIACIEGFANGFLEHGTPGIEYKEAMEFCNMKVMTPKEKESCLIYGLNLSGWYSKTKAAEICKTLTEEYKKYCR